jgi:peptide/nickel transport system substrate-binding protein
VTAGQRTALGSAERTRAVEAISRQLAENPVHLVVCAVPNNYVGLARLNGMEALPMSTVLNTADVRGLSMH